MTWSRSFGRISMRGRVTLLIGSAMTPLAAFLIASVVSDYESTLYAARREVLQSAGIASARQSEVFSSSRMVLDTLRRSTTISPAGGEACSRLLGRIKSANPQFRSVGVVDASGNVTCHNEPASPTETKTLDFMRGALAGQQDFVISDILISAETNAPSIVVAMPLRDDFEKPVGMVFAALDLDDLANKAESLSEGGRRAVTLVQPSSGRFLSYYPAVDFKPGVLVADHPLVEAMRRAPAGGVTEATGLGGRERIFGFEPIDGAGAAGLMVAIGESRQALIDPIRARAVHSAVIGAITLSIALLASWWLGDRLQSQPVLRLTRAARRIGSGDFRARSDMEPWQSPELRELGHTLDSMAVRLAEGRKAELEVAASEARYRLLAANIADLVTCVDANGIRTFASLSSKEVVGWEPEEIVGRQSCELVHPDDQAIAAMMMAPLAGGVPVTDVRYRMRHKQGHYIWVGVSGRASNERGQFVFTIRDVTARKKTEDELEQANRRLASLASTDGLTGLLNRRAFDVTLHEAIAANARDSRDLSLLMIDVDHFKRYNDRYGHLAGDEALRAVAGELRLVLRRSGIAVARYGGEEFGVILPQTPLSVALQQADDLRGAVRRLAVAHEDSEHGIITLSIGVATVSAGSAILSSADFVGRADRALYTAKRNGRDRTEFVIADIAIAS